MESFCEQVNQNDMLPKLRNLQVGIGDWLMVGIQSFMFLIGNKDHTKLDRMEKELKEEQLISQKIQ